jgi:response regulator RpfG family c-di-GMP phosphodiesterase
MSQRVTPHGRGAILVVDDQEPNVHALRRILESAGYPAVEGITDPRLAVSRFKALQPDLVLVDLQMPGLDGFAVLEQLRALRPADTFLPIVVLTGDDSMGARERALALGATDFIAKPFHVTEVLLRIRNLLESRYLHLLLHDEKSLLERRVEEQSRELRKAQLEVLVRLGRAAEFRDDETGHHAQRVGELAAWVGREAGLDEEAVLVLRHAAPLHDIGKIGIPDRILLKPGTLTPEEFEVMKTHTTIGAALLTGGGTPIARTAEAIALAHHERWDGQGYPHGQAGPGIPLEARLVSLADFFDALTHDRPYRPAWPRERVLAMIVDERERRFDPRLVDAFFGLDHSMSRCSVELE